MTQEPPTSEVVTEEINGAVTPIGTSGEPAELTDAQETEFLLDEASDEQLSGQIEVVTEGENDPSTLNQASARAMGRLERWNQQGGRTRFLAELARTGNVTKAARAGRISEATAYVRKAQDPVFSRAWDEAKGRLINDVEQAAIHRALHGSDRLAEFILKSRKRAEYGEKVEMTVTGHVAHLHVTTTDCARIVAEGQPLLAARLAQLKRIGQKRE